MSHLESFCLYLAITLLLQVWLTMRIALYRRAHRISLGDGDDSVLRKRIRIHGNFTEIMPIALIGLLGLSLLQIPIIWIHVFGAGFIVTRLLHMHGMVQRGAIGPARPLGVMLTMALLIGEAIWLIYTVVN